MTDLFISIATMNSRERLRACLESLPAACEGLEWSVTVVDNCSSDGTADMLRSDFPGVGLIENDRLRGFGSNHNQALNEAMTRELTPGYALVLNDDTLLEAGSVTALVACARADASIGAATPTVLTPAGDRDPTAFKNLSQPEMVFAAFTGWPRIKEAASSPDWLNGCCLLFPFQVLEEVGLFDQRFYMFSEDVDLTTRVRLAGYRLAVCEESRIIHYGSGTVARPSISQPMRQQMARSYFLYLEKHNGRWAAQIVTQLFRCAHLVRGLAAIVVGLAGRDAARRARGLDRLRLAGYSPSRPIFPDRENV